VSACTTVDLSVREEPRTPSPVTTAPASSPPAASVASPSAPESASVVKKPGGYYLDDGPADKVPEGLLDTPDAEPKIEPYAKGPSKPYTVFEQTYVLRGVTPVVVERITHDAIRAMRWLSHLEGDERVENRALAVRQLSLEEVSVRP